MGNFYKKFERHVKHSLQTGVSVNKGPVEEPGGGTFTRTFDRKKENTYLGSFIFDPEDIKR